MDNEYYGEENRQYSPNRPQYFLSKALLKDLPENRTVLDLGSGLGEFSDHLKNIGHDVYGVEGVKEFVANQTERGLNVHHVNLEEEDLPFSDNAFDIVISLDVIEHLWNTKHYLKEIYRCLKPNGFFIVSTVNYNYWKYRLLHLKGQMEDFVFESRHKKFYTYKSLQLELEPLFNITGMAFWNENSNVSRLKWPNLRAQLFAFLCEPKIIS